jgi:hypothetical protein
MFTLIRSIPTRQLLLEQVPAFAISFVIAELFYKFHSFTLECMAFLLTWYVLDAAINFLKNLLRP